MEIRYICTYWGQEDVPVDQFVRKAMDAGYDGVEMNIPDEKGFTSALQRALEDHGALLVAQQWLPPATESFEQYATRMSSYLERLLALRPALINSHTGKDYFTFEKNCALIEECAVISSGSSIPILHETHRGRFAFHSASLLPYLEKYPDLSLSADLSHLCTVSESLLADQERILEKILPACRYIHARVGSDQSPQVNHPFAPEWQENLHRFLSWWKQIAAHARERGDQVLHICPEAGPAPYMPALPFTGKPVADQWEINTRMMQFLKEELG